MQANLKNGLILLVICSISLALRLFMLDQAPKGALIDEAHFGYLAYSLLETGKDEHGFSFPLIFTGFGDNKLPAGAYVMIPVVKFFGLSNATIRYPSVVAGVLLSIVMFMLLKQLRFSDKYSLVGAALVALAPWTFFLSRFGFESNLALVTFTAGLACLVSFAHTPRPITGLMTGLLLGSTWYAYISYRPIVVGLVGWMIVTQLLLHKKKLLTEAKAYVSLVGALLITIAPFFAPSVIGVNGTRLNQVGIFSDPSLVPSIIENRTFCTQHAPKLWCYALWNKPTVVGRTLVYRYTSVFSPQYLATTGEGENKFLTIEGFGSFYYLMYPLILIGLIGLVIPLQKTTLSKTASSLLIGGLLLTPLPTILVGPPQPVRLSPLIPFLLILCVHGLRVLLSLIQHASIRAAVAGIVLLGLSFQSVWFFTDYYFVHSEKNEYYYQSYLPQLHDFLQTLDPATQIVFRPFYSDPLMFYAYYTQMNPAEYQAQARLGELEASGFQHTVGLGRVQVSSNSITHVGCEQKQAGHQAVYVTNEALSAPILYKGMSTNGVHAFVYVYDATSKLTAADCELFLTTAAPAL